MFLYTSKTLKDLIKDLHKIKNYIKETAIYSCEGKNIREIYKKDQRFTMLQQQLFVDPKPRLEGAKKKNFMGVAFR